ANIQITPFLNGSIQDIFSSPIIFLPFHLNYSKICEIRQIPEFRGRYFGEAPTGRSAKRKASTASFSPTGRRPSNVAGAQRTTPQRGGRPANETQTSNLLQSARSAKSAGDTLAKPQTHEVPNEKRAPRAFHQPAEGHQTCREHSERHPNGW